MLRARYSLTFDGIRRCDKEEFYLQETPRYRGCTEKIFHALYGNALTIAEISQNTGLDKRSVSSIVHHNFKHGYIQREIIL